MEYHLNRTLRLNVNEGRGLYTWAINEILENGEVANCDQIPWHWSFAFVATECILGDIFCIEKSYSDKDPKSPPEVNERPHIRMQLRSWTRHSINETKFSMFGTDRVINDIALFIRPMIDTQKYEYCHVGGVVSYTAEDDDFINKIERDILEFTLFVKQDRFDKFALAIRAGQIDQISFNVGGVSGFYSGWSPSISTDRVKVLTAGEVQHIETAANPEIEIPRLGTVRNCDLYFRRRLVFANEHVVTEQVDQLSEFESRPTQNNALNTDTIEDPEMLKILRSLKSAAWWAVVFIAVIMIRNFIR